MAGIYVHIPFCKQACHYCNFHFSTSLKLQNDFLDALLKEIALRSSYLEGRSVSTIYFGGGTPSLLPGEQLVRIIDRIGEVFTVNSEAEITLEANPDDIGPNATAQWTTAGVNRLSIGIQSFYDADLRWMNRAHDAAQARACIDTARDAGITNMSIDLIYGTPTLPDEHWQQNLSKAADCGIPHLSCYALTVEPRTPLEHFIRKKKMQPVNADDQARQFTLMTEILSQKGYEHYEISNFAQPGKRSQHNSSYWNGAPYLGLGPSAHSFNGHSRQWNIANNPLYIQSLARDEVPFEKEDLTTSQRFNEYIMTSLRTLEGTDTSFVRETFGSDYLTGLLKDSEQFVRKGWIEQATDRLVLTQEGKLFADGIAVELFILP